MRLGQRKIATVLYRAHTESWARRICSRRHQMDSSEILQQPDRMWIDWRQSKVASKNKTRVTRLQVGMFSLLDDICYTIHAQSGTGTDLRFLEKAVGSFSQHPHFRGFNGAFQIKHYAVCVLFCTSSNNSLGRRTALYLLQLTSLGYVQCGRNEW